MPEIVQCPECSRKLRVPDELLGRKVKCPTCSANFQATAVGGDNPQAPPDSGRAADERPSRRRDEAPDDDEDEDRLSRRSRRSRRDRRDAEPHRGTIILVLGIISIVLNFIIPGLGVIPGPIAWAMGSADLKKIRSGEMDSGGEGTTNGGMICGIIGTILGSLGLLCCGGYIIFVMVIAVGGNL
jgi:predicted Zn finger-like uncharacterized protein